MLSDHLKTCSSHRILYLGLELPLAFAQKNAVHFPIIQIVPHSFDIPRIQQIFSHISEYTHIILTSKTAVRLFFQTLAFYKFNLEQLTQKIFIVVGKSTAQVLQQYQIKADIVACNETAEGIIEELVQIDCAKAYFFWPHSEQSRPIIANFFKQRRIRYQECVLYKTVPITSVENLPNLSQFDEIVFTSPSTVNAFIAIFGKIPENVCKTAIGPITQACLDYKNGFS